MADQRDLSTSTGQSATVRSSSPKASGRSPRSGGRCCSGRTRASSRIRRRAGCRSWAASPTRTPSPSGRAGRRRPAASRSPPTRDRHRPGELVPLLGERVADQPVDDRDAGRAARSVRQQVRVPAAHHSLERTAAEACGLAEPAVDRAETVSCTAFTGRAAGPTPSNARWAIARWRPLIPCGADASSSTPSLTSACASDIDGAYARRPIASVPMNAERGARLRQAVLVARDLAPVSDRLRSELGLGEPFADPGVGAFGLHNAVYAIGDTFLEVISPTQDGTTAGRYLDRHGDGGYMVIFQLADLDAARERAAAMGMRVVWQLDLPDISGTHLHPADTRGAIVSLDRADPPGSWRWGGPDWTGARDRRARAAARRDDRGGRPGRDRSALGRAARRRALRRGGRARRTPSCASTGGRGAADRGPPRGPRQARDHEIGGATFRMTPPD